MSYPKRQSAVVFLLLVMMCLVLSSVAQGAKLAEESIRVTISIPPMHSVRILRSDTTFSYNGSTVEKISTIQVELKINSPWILDVQVQPLPGGVIPQIRPQVAVATHTDTVYVDSRYGGVYAIDQNAFPPSSTIGQYNDTVKIVGKQLGLYIITFDVFIPESRHLPSGDYDLVFDFQTSHALN